MERIINYQVFHNVTNKKPIYIDVTIGIDGERGWFEFADMNTGGYVCHYEGSLTFDKMSLQDYDGVFELPSFINEKLIQLGYNID